MFVKFLAFLAIIVAAIAITVAQPGESYPAIDNALPLQRVDGVRQQFGDFKGKPLLVTFWSPTCVICMAEVNDMNQLYQTANGGSDFELLAFSMYYDRPDWVMETRQQKAMQYPVYFDLEKKLSRAFGNVVATPTTFLIDARGQIVYRHAGRLDFDLLAQKLSQLAG
jgi:cytochrome oxidase Cu insertion factor (SCO1/SenC/PrrC family)